MDLSLSNPFAALEVRKAKKKKQSELDKKKRGPKSEQNLRLEQEIFGKRQSNVSDWADDDEWATDPVTDGQANGANGKGPHSDLHDSEEEIDLEEHFGVELGPEDEHEDHEEKEKHEPTPEELALLEEHRKKYQIQPQRKVSKKELKKKEMEDLDDLLADLGIDVTEGQKSQESSNKKKKKKNKEKMAGEEPSLSASAQQNQDSTEEGTAEEAPSSLTPEEIRNKLEKTKGTKKRTTSKKCIEIAAAEAKARNKGKKGKRDATHYNQAPNH